MSKNGVLKFHSVKKGYIMSVEEKLWLCREVLGENLEWNGQIKTKKGIISRYGLCDSWYQKNMPIFLDKKKEFHGKTGSPGSIDHLSQIVVATKVNEREKAINNIKKTELIVVLNKEVIETMKRKGKLDPNFETLDPRAIKRQFVKHGIDISSPDVTTEARVVACLCPRMSYVWFLICYALSRDLPGCAKWNANGSTYVFEARGKGDKVCTLASDGSMQLLLKQIDQDRPDPPAALHISPKSSARRKKTVGASNALPFAIKVMQLCNAEGDAGPACVIIAVKSMPPDVFSVQKVMGLSWTAQMGGEGYVYFSRTRCGTKAMWLDWFSEVCIPFLRLSNKTYKRIAVDGTTHLPSLLSTDGEDIILSNVYTELALRDSLRDSNITYARVGAGTTSIHNACDRAFTFRETKKRVRIYRRDNKQVLNEMLEINMITAFNALQSEFTEVTISAAFRKDMIDGLTLLMHAYSHTMTRDMVMRGFSVCGQHCPPNDHGHTVDFSKMLYQCYSDITVADMDNMWEQRDLLSGYLLARGSVSWAEMDAAGIPTVPESINREQLTHIRHASEIVSHAEVVRKYVEKQRLSDPVFIAEQRELAAAEKLLEKVQQEQEKKDSTIARRLAETERMAALEPEERRREKAQKAFVKQQSQLAKKNVALEKQAAARALIAQRALFDANRGVCDTSDSEIEGDEGF